MRPGRGLEVDRAVGLDRHLGEDSLDAFFLHDRHRRSGVAIGLVPGRVGLVVQLEDSQVLDRVSGHVRQALADVGAEEDAAFDRLAVLARARPDDPVRLPRRHGPRFDGNRVPDVVDAFVDQVAVAVYVHQVQAELVSDTASRDEEILFRKRIRRLVAGEAARGVVVGGFRRVHGRGSDLRPGQIGGDLGQSVREVPALVRVDDPDRSRPPVVVPHAGEHHSPAAGNRPRLGEMIGPDGLVAPEVRRAGPVLVRRPQLLKPPKRLVGVFPTGIDHSAVVEQGGHEVRLAVVADQVDVAAVGVAAGKDIGVNERPAADIRVAPGSGEEDVAVGQVDRIDVVIFAIGQLPKARPVEVHLVQVKALVIVRLVAEEDLLGVERQIGPPEAPGFSGASWRSPPPGCSPSSTSSRPPGAAMIPMR